jgi:hypothetical protein
MVGLGAMPADGSANLSVASRNCLVQSRYGVGVVGALFRTLTVNFIPDEQWLPAKKNLAHLCSGAKTNRRTQSAT